MYSLDQISIKIYLLILGHFVVLFYKLAFAKYSLLNLHVSIHPTVPFKLTFHPLSYFIVIWFLFPVLTVVHSYSPSKSVQLTVFELALPNKPYSITHDPDFPPKTLKKLFIIVLTILNQPALTVLQWFVFVSG